MKPENPPRRRKIEVHAHKDGELLGIYVAEGPRAASWASRANPGAALRARSQP